MNRIFVTTILLISIFTAKAQQVTYKILEDDPKNMNQLYIQLSYLYALLPCQLK